MAPSIRVGCVIGFLTICWISLALGEKISTEKDSHVLQLKRNDLNEFVRKASVTIIYFFKREYTLVNNFLKEYEKSASLLEIYNVELAKLNCNEQGPVETNEYCDNEGTEENLYAFKDGQELLALSLENTFDVNSIVSNILQIALIRDVPILQTQKERRDFEQQYHGKNDIIFSFQTAIGTQEHRAFMEVAFAFKNKYKFAVTTETPVISDLVGRSTGESAMIWLIRCKTATSGSPCYQSKYHDNIDLPSLVRYLRVLDIETIHDTSVISEKPKFEEFGLHEVFIIYKKEMRDEIETVAKSLNKIFNGVLGIVLMEEGFEAVKEVFSVGLEQLPAVAIKLRGSDQPLVMPGIFNSLSVEAFVSHALDSTLREESLIEPPVPFEEEDEADEGMLAEVEKQDDQVAEAVSRLDDVEIDRSFIPVLTDKTFTPQTTESNLKIVLFYLTFDAESMAFMRSYVDASFMLANDKLHPLAAIDCFDWTDVCGKNNITSYPTIRIYRKGHDYTTYKGMLGAIPIVSLAKMLLVESPLVLSKQEDHDRFVKGEYPSNLKDATDTAVVGIFRDKGDVKEFSSFKRVADLEFGNTLFGYASPGLLPSLCKYYGVEAPVIVLLKRHDKLNSVRILNKDIRTSTILSFVKEASLAIFPEITPVNFPAYFSQKKPFVLLFDENILEGQGAHGEVAAVAATMQFPQFIFGWLELTRDDGVGGKILLEYNSEAEPPSLFIVDHSTAAIYSYQGGEVKRDQVDEWLRSVHRGEIKPWKMLQNEEWKPLNPGYDFLRMIDEENAEEEERSAYKAPPMWSRRTAPPDEEKEKQIRAELHSMYLQSNEMSSTTTKTPPNMENPHSEL